MDWWEKAQLEEEVMRGVSTLPRQLSESWLLIDGLHEIRPPPPPCTGTVKG